jgi:PAS domain S-box-containing protein
MNLLNWFARGGGGSYESSWWVWVTFALSALVAAGYCATAVDWYFQDKLARRSDSAAAQIRLLLICVCCGTCAYIFYQTEMPWLVWRLYDVALLAFAVSIWSFVIKTRGGLGLVEQRLAQVQELETNATRYREIAELLPHIVWTATAGGHVDFSNQRWREYAGDHATWIDAVHPDERDRVRRAWKAALESCVPVALEARLRSVAGTWRTFAIKATPIVRGTDAVKWLGACADIEDQKILAAEKEMQARQRSFFLNALSHDLRAPLHNVLLNAELLKMNVVTAAPIDTVCVEMIMENAVAAGDLVAKLLDFARVGAQEYNVTESVAVVPLLNQVARRFQPAAEKKGLYVRVTESAQNTREPVFALADRLKLERIVANLVDNAIKYTRAGGVSIELIAHQTDQVADAEFAIRVRDTGIGILPENVPFLFDEFYQVNNHERDRSKGFGMGLAICKSLARHIGASVRLARTGSEGSCFEITLRRVRADRGGRPGGEAGDRRDPAQAGLCRV